MTNRLKGVTRQVRLRVQCWWLNREVDRVARRIARGTTWQTPAESDRWYRTIGWGGGDEMHTVSKTDGTGSFLRSPGRQRAASHHEPAVRLLRKRPGSDDPEEQTGAAILPSLGL